MFNDGIGFTDDNGPTGFIHLFCVPAEWDIFLFVMIVMNYLLTIRYFFLFFLVQLLFVFSVLFVQQMFLSADCPFFRIPGIDTSPNSWRFEDLCILLYYLSPTLPLPERPYVVLFSC